MLKYAKFSFQNGLPAYSDPWIIQQSFCDAGQSHVVNEKNVMALNSHLLKVKQEFEELSANLVSLQKDLFHLTNKHILPMQKSLQFLLPTSTCTCYHEQGVLTRSVDLHPPLQL